MEFGRWVGTQFFPSQVDLKKALQNGSICIASKTRTLGDALIAASIAQPLKEKYPDLKIFTYNRAFNSVVTQNHPAFSGTAWFPRAVFGDDCNEGSGHLIQLKRQWFGLKGFDLKTGNDDIRPDIYLSDGEIKRAQTWLLENGFQDDRRLLVIHPWGHTWTHVLSAENWNEILSEPQQRFQVLQIGVEGQKKVDAADGYFFSNKDYQRARLLFAIMRQAHAFIGVNSGPMHVAKAFEVSSFILIQEGDIGEIFKNRFEYPYFQKGNQTRGFLYESNQHFCLKTSNPLNLKNKIYDFLQRT